MAHWSGFRNTSGLPMIGTILVVIGTVLGFGPVGTALLGLGCTAVDTGGFTATTPVIKS